MVSNMLNLLVTRINLIRVNYCSLSANHDLITRLNNCNNINYSRVLFCQAGKDMSECLPKVFRLMIFGLPKIIHYLIKRFTNNSSVFIFYSSFKFNIYA
jgi:hypothetical protein